MKIVLTGKMDKSFSSYIIRDLLNSLKDKFDVHVNPKSDIVCVSEQEKILLSNFLLSDISCIDINITVSDCVNSPSLPSKKNILYLINDYESVKDADALNLYDEIWVMSNWAKSNISKYTIKRCLVIPFGIDIDVIDKIKEKDQTDHLKFFTISNWNDKKNIDFIVTSFCSAFKNTDNVSLNIYMNGSTIKDKYNLQWLAINNHKFSNHFFKYRNTSITLSLINDYFHTKQQYYESINQFDFGVFPYKSDCISMPLLEMMSLGKPCICINHSGCSDYVDSFNSYSINKFHLIQSIDEKNNVSTGTWAEIDKSTMISTLIKCKEESNTTNQNKIKKYAQELKYLYSLSNTIKNIITRLELL